MISENICTKFAEISLFPYKQCFLCHVCPRSKMAEYHYLKKDGVATFSLKVFLFFCSAQST